MLSESVRAAHWSEIHHGDLRLIVTSPLNKINTLLRPNHEYSSAQNTRVLDLLRETGSHDFETLSTNDCLHYNMLQQLLTLHSNAVLI